MCVCLCGAVALGISKIVVFFAIVLGRVHMAVIAQYRKENSMLTTC